MAARSSTEEARRRLEGESTPKGRVICGYLNLKDADFMFLVIPEVQACSCVLSQKDKRGPGLAS